ncbi:DUF4097 family beta strand repeat-containing protein [Herbiconiux sp. A18JL235]|uniref:DUF4097 family beta strand repeat-containing protein n=1 Tax=Herbiconiux sp. A18JL235 TaxID=3152363 RepID=A0AB39BGB0_9MICO
MTVPTTPPPVAAQPVNAPQGRPDRTLRTALLAVGSALVAAVLVLGVVQFAQASTGDDESGAFTVADPFDTVVVDTSAVTVSVRYDDSRDTALVDFDSDGSPLRFEHRVNAERLEVSVRSRGWWPFGGVIGLNAHPRLEVVLPGSLEPVALEVGTSAGEVDLAGDFAAVRVDSSAGAVTLSGSADSLDLSSSAGSITGTDLDVTGPVTSETSAGTMTLGFVSLPSSMHVEAAAGDVRVALPDGEYEIRTDTAVGSVAQGLRSTPGASRVYSFETSAGDVVLEQASR